MERREAEPEPALRGLLVSTAFAYAHAACESPRTVLEDFFCEMPSDEEWEAELLPLIELRVSALVAARIERERSLWRRGRRRVAGLVPLFARRFPS